MKRNRKTVLLITGCFILVSTLLTCLYLRHIAFGPRPVGNISMSPIVRQVAAATQTCIEHDLIPQDANALKSTGKLVLSWEDMKTRYPNLAVAIDNYSEYERLKLIQYYRGSNRPIPSILQARLAVHRSPDRVEIKRTPNVTALHLYCEKGYQHLFLTVPNVAP